MTKHPDYSAISADEVTSLFDDIYRRQLALLRDKKKGTLLTAFQIASTLIGPDVAALRDAVLEKNGIGKIQATDVCHDYLPEIVAAVEARGSDAAKSIKAYIRFVSLSETCYQMLSILNPPPTYSGPLAEVRSAYDKIKARIEIGRGMSF